MFDRCIISHWAFLSLLLIQLCSDKTNFRCNTKFPITQEQKKYLLLSESPAIYISRKSSVIMLYTVEIISIYAQILLCEHLHCMQNLMRIGTYMRSCFFHSLRCFCDDVIIVSLHQFYKSAPKLLLWKYWTWRAVSIEKTIQFTDLHEVMISHRINRI